MYYLALSISLLCVANVTQDRARRESEKQLLDVQSQLELERIQAQKMKDTEYTLRSQLSMVEEVCLSWYKCVLLA